MHQAAAHHLGPQAIGQVAIEGGAGAVGGHGGQLRAAAVLGHRPHVLGRRDDVLLFLGQQRLARPPRRRGSFGTTWSRRVAGEHRLVVHLAVGLLGVVDLLFLGVVNSTPRLTNAISP